MDMTSNSERSYRRMPLAKAGIALTVAIMAGTFLGTPAWAEGSGPRPAPPTQQAAPKQEYPPIGSAPQAGQGAQPSGGPAAQT